MFPDGLGAHHDRYEDGRQADAAKLYGPAETASQTEGSSRCSARVLDCHFFATYWTSRICASISRR